MSSPVEEQEEAPHGAGRDSLARGVVAALVVLIVAGLALAVVLIVRDRPKHTNQPGQASVSTTDVPPSAAPSSIPMPAAVATDAAGLAAYVNPWVVEMTIKRAGGTQAAGTGIVLNARGEFLANDSVVAGALSITGTIGGAAAPRTFTATVIGHDSRRDVALLQLEGASGLQTPKFATTATVVSAGEPVVAVGHAPTAGADPAMIPGIVLALNQRVPATNPDSESRRLRGLIQIYASIQPADTGGPVLDAAGQVIAVNVAGAGKTQAAVPVAYAIPIRTALQAAQQIRRGNADAGPGAVTGTARQG
jgi:S1-C subfamily serine protease